ncbi:capsule biosynthesis protein [Desulfovibrio sp. OttesenSCG-928-G15]|nr:capsule biosynthesis protein [Desulfovibrio sp. OttesenSCG-928-G15]
MKLQLPSKALKKQKPYIVVKSLIKKDGRRNRLMNVFVFIPTIIVGLYLLFVYSDMYVSESHFALRSSDSADAGALSSLLTPTMSGMPDAFIVKEFIASLAMMDKVEESVDVKKHYSDKSRDVFSRLKSNPTREEMWRYWQWITQATFDIDKGIISVEVKAYTPEMAKAINDTILAASEDLVNQMNDRAHQDAIRLMSKEVSDAENRLLDAQLALQKFRDDKSVLNPTATASGIEQVITKLEAQAANLEAELSATLKIMSPGSGKIKILEGRLQALRKQLNTERSRLAGLRTGGSALSSLVGGYSQLVTEEEFAKERLVKSMAALEMARLKAISQSRYIVPYQPPTLPEESSYPKPFLFTLFCFFALLTGLGLISLCIAAVKDHMGV